ncbi:MAG: YjhX family toxin [Dongiaceae bacterium]
MNVSRHEQRVLHALAQGGHIAFEKDGKGKIIEVLCFNREGWVLSDCTLGIFRKLKRRGLIASANSGPYRITRDGLAAVRSQLDNR